MTVQDKTDTVLVTGISGFLGGHVALAFLNSGFRVRGSVRDLSKSAKVSQTLANAGADTSRLDFVALDLLSDTGWTEAMQGARFLVHTASPFLTSIPDDPEVLIRPAVDGTKRAINAALAAKVERIVLTSSMAAIMYGHPKDRTSPFTASDWTVPNGTQTNAYTLSKLYAEQAAWQLMDAAKRHTDMAVINPAFIQGPLLDEDPGTSGMLVLRMMKGHFPATPRMMMPAIDVRDVAEAHVLAITNPTAGGQRFPMAASSPTLLASARAVGQALPAFAGKIPKFELPDWLTRFAGLFDKDIRAASAELGQNRRVDASAAIALLGHPLISADEAYVEMARSIIRHGLVKAPR